MKAAPTNTARIEPSPFVFERELIEAKFNPPSSDSGRTQVSQSLALKASTDKSPKLLSEYPTLQNKLSSSDFSIQRDGSLVEEWATTLTYPSQLIELSSDSVTLECLINSETKSFEIRKFRRSLLEGVITFRLKSIVLIKVFERPGKFVLEFHDAPNLGYEKYFTTGDELDEINIGAALKP